MLSRIFVLKNPKTVDKLQNNLRVYRNDYSVFFLHAYTVRRHDQSHQPTHALILTYSMEQSPS